LSVRCSFCMLLCRARPTFLAGSIEKILIRGLLTRDR
jgi:hypothetical protein